MRLICPENYGPGFINRVVDIVTTVYMIDQNETIFDGRKSETFHYRRSQKAAIYPTPTPYPNPLLGMFALPSSGTIRENKEPTTAIRKISHTAQF